MRQTFLDEVIDTTAHRLADLGAELSAASHRLPREKLPVDPGGARRAHLRLDRKIGTGGERQASTVARIAQYSGGQVV